MIKFGRTTVSADNNKVRPVAGVVLAFALACTVAACGSSEEPTAASSSSSAVAIQESTTSAPAVTTTIAPAPVTAAPPAAITPEPVAAVVLMPPVVCLNLQAAQNLIQDAGVFFSRSEDATGASRMQVNDSNWIVVDQQPGVGVPIGEGDAVLSVVKIGEPNNC
ncbi:hypothetical protein QMK17_16980 [Rhodococcus sp. G-MC3]|uniref:hypothetical protein n=1 Tax=Rhodococcus sp. G-MC3 TaxID=3046209 RepID=UPI0024B9B87D|nr:hypothetical protein [Rhodococcus sp. G-MC3]MDJ0395020.1 hypothetical protein [Rhodococcus sp. G-MC3]